MEGKMGNSIELVKIISTLYSGKILVEVSSAEFQLRGVQANLESASKSRLGCSILANGLVVAHQGSIIPANFEIRVDEIGLL